MGVITAQVCREVMFLSCLSVCLSVSLCLCVCVSVQTVTFEADGIEAILLAQW